MARRLDRDAAERVLRRAVELGDQPGTADDAFEPDVLVSAASDLGVPTTAVHRALAEEQAGLLADDAGAVDRLAGPAAVSAARVVDMKPGAAMSLADEWLRRTWAFKRVRSTEQVADYRRRTDVVATVQRSARSLTGKENADKVRSIRLITHELEAQRSIVAMVVDLQSSRTFAEVGGSFVAGGGTVMSTVSALAWAPWAWLGIPASAAAGAGVLATRRAWTRGIDVELEGLLDLIEAGEVPPSMVGGLAERFRRPAPPGDVSPPA
ncbi:MAG: hypothetical protein GY812_07680 [Actinomycetia bacterium]|nr:hypothetical protein [Actinomycetes bacterium]